MRTTQRFWMMVAAAAWGGACFLSGFSLAREPAPTVEVLLKSDKTILGQPISYPASAPSEVTAAIITMPPGASTGWHKHEVPLFAYILEGEVTVAYEGHGKRTYRKGDSFMEAIGTPHDGTSTGEAPASILAVFIGAEGAKNTVKISAPAP
jgi:quercetin dioxygenase-like cupin family protein